MKKFYLVLSILVVSFVANAQTEERKGFIAITLGPSIPLGEFGDNNLNNDKAGFAKTGLNFNLINFGYKFGTNFGIAGSWLGAAHSVDIDGIDDATWSYGGVFGGLLLSLPANDKLFFEFKPMLGFISATSPKLSVGGSTVLENQQGTAIGFDFGASVRYNFSEKWCMLINLDYLTAKPKFDNDFEQSISSMNLNFGIGYRLK